MRIVQTEQKVGTKMRNENQNTNWSHEPTDSVRTAPQKVDETHTSFSDWLDNELAAVEARFEDFVTNRSKLRSFGR